MLCHLLCLHHSLEVQLTISICTIINAVNRLRAMLPEVHSIFTQVESLVRFLLVVPCSSAEAERSFSALRRLKTWLRSTMSQRRLNKLDQNDIREICQLFISAMDSRRNVFADFIVEPHLNQAGFIWIYIPTLKSC